MATSRLILRRAARLLLTALFATGALLLLWLPYSFAYLAFVDFSSPIGVQAIVSRGNVQVNVFEGENVWRSPMYSDSVGVRYVEETGLVAPRFDRIGRDSLDSPHFIREVWSHTPTIWRLSTPIWLLAAVCLAWPVTSFIVARRRHGRGFPISLAPFPPGEVPGEADKGDRESMSTSIS